jgi:hypothetical protein
MTNETLSRLIEWAKMRTMTPAERREQRRSFVYGNCKIENERITREMVEEADLRLARNHANCAPQQSAVSGKSEGDA